MGYLGTGDGSGAYKDFWQYNPATDSWLQKANFGGVARSSATGFSLNGKGYIGTGYGAGPMNDFWEYNPLTNNWTQKADFAGGARSDGISFSICDKGYISSGVSSASMDKNDLWEYDPVSDSWTQKASYAGSGREDPVGFSDGTSGYIGTGTNIFSEFGDFYQYTPDCLVLPIGLTDFTAVQQDHSININWTTETELNNEYFTVEKSLDANHFEAIALVKGSGTSSSSLTYHAADAFPFTGLNYYRLKQTDYNGSFSYSNIISCVASGLGMMKVLSVNPNPVTTFIDITTDISDDEELNVELLTVNGRLVLRNVYFVKKDIQHLYVDLADVLEGIYFLRVSCEYGSFSTKLVKIN